MDRRWMVLIAMLLAFLPPAPAGLSSSKHARSQARGDMLTIAMANLSHNIVTVPDLVSRQVKEYILAGDRQFHSLWARDFSFAALGALEMGRTAPVKDTLEIIYGYQRADGVMPRHMDNISLQKRFLLGSLGIQIPFKNPLRTEFETENGVVAIDGNALVPWIASEYIKKTGDRDFAAKWWSGTEQALEYLQREHLEDGLIGKQPPFGDWADSVAREGKVSFTNILYILALRGASDWAAMLGLNEKAAEYAYLAATTQSRFYEYFWLPSRKMVMNFTGDDHLTADANLFAVAYNILPYKESVQVMNTLRASPLWNPLPGRATWPDYTKSQKSFLPRLGGVADYHDRMYWLWLSAVAAQAEKAIGNVHGCEWVLEQLADVVRSKGIVYEVYSSYRSGNALKIKPVMRPLYRAEGPFSWSAGYIVQSELLGCD